MGFFRRTDAPQTSGAAVAAEVSGATLALLAASQGGGRERAMRIPTISRARDLLAGLVSTTPLIHYVDDVEVPLEPWMGRPDQKTTRAHIMAWTLDDLLFQGRAYWHISARYATGYPSAFTWVPANTVEIESPLWAGNYPVGGVTSIQVSGRSVSQLDLITFYASNGGLLEVGARAITIAERLDTAALRFATNPIAMGYLKQTGGEPMTGDELADLSSSWETLRADNATAALNEYVSFTESNMDPSRLQLVEARQHQALELARVANISPGLVGAPTGSGMTYANVVQARAQLVQDALPYLTVIEETLSGAQVSARGHSVKFDRTELITTATGAA